jgi:hypothetical protein
VISKILPSTVVLAALTMFAPAAFAQSTAQQPATPAQTAPAPPAAAAVAPAPDQPVKTTPEPTTAEVLLDRIDKIVTKAIDGSEPKLPSGEPGAVATSGQAGGSETAVRPSGGKVTIDRAALEEIRAEVEQLKSLIRRPQ